MSKFGLFAATSCLVFATSASAQSWYGYSLRGSDATPYAGPYIGIHGGYAVDMDNTTYVAGATPTNQANLAGGLRPTQLIRDKDGYAAGGQIGWNVQGGNVVAGVEGDFSMTDMSTRAGRVGLSGATSNVLARNNYFASVRGRLGYVLSGVLLYGTGGYATTEIKDRARFRNPQGQTAFYGSHEYDPSGWVAGAGLEYALPAAFMSRYGGFLGAGHVTTGVEWLHYDFDDKNLNVGSVGGGVTGSGGGYVARFSNNADVIRARINYKF